MESLYHMLYSLKITLKIPSFFCCFSPHSWKFPPQTLPETSLRVLPYLLSLSLTKMTTGPSLRSPVTQEKCLKDPLQVGDIVTSEHSGENYALIGFSWAAISHMLRLLHLRCPLIWGELRSGWWSIWVLWCLFTLLLIKTVSHCSIFTALTCFIPICHRCHMFQVFIYAILPTYIFYFYKDTVSLLSCLKFQYFLLGTGQGLVTDFYFRKCLAGLQLHTYLCLSSL